MDAVALKSISFAYQATTAAALSVPDLRIPQGQRVALIGASGAGKSTLMRLLDGRLRGWQGRARVLDQELDPTRRPPRAWRRQVGFIFQSYALVERLDLHANVLNGRLGHISPWASLTGRFSPRDHQIAHAALAEVGLADLAGRRVDRLSGGQRQRVAIARCLAQEPAMILADEPISSLDPETAATVLQLLQAIVRQRGATLILSSHQPQLIAPHVDRFIAMDAGRIVFDGRPADLDEERLAAIYKGASDVRAA
ncbi:phosphonate ABC transporter ATP-binding protein [Pseudogemmobacter bohemicus]|uniref:phosphonate ABC transporter ATP-binding protein n=1 Tax=Pseudogemmobacter bohemicus TaxID=2250708 RepID=UPI000DD45091|nr:ATP-binding cassette domain-containing protein [Pseudogemmobacter bohemicus]